MKKKTIKADKKYLLIPVADSKGWFLPVDEMQFLGVYRDGVLLEEHEVVLSKEPRCWACLYLERYEGQELELRLEGGEESLLTRCIGNPPGPWRTLPPCTDL